MGAEPSLPEKYFDRESSKSCKIALLDSLHPIIISNNKDVLSQGEPRDAAENFDIEFYNGILRFPCHSTRARPFVGLCRSLQTVDNPFSLKFLKKWPPK